MQSSSCTQWENLKKKKRQTIKLVTTSKIIIIYCCHSCFHRWIILSSVALANFIQGSHQVPAAG